MKYRYLLICLLGQLLITFSSHAQVATIDQGILNAGANLVVSVRATAALTNLNVLDLRLKPLDLKPVWSVGALMQEGKILLDPADPWHVGLLSDAPVNGPGELLHLTLTTNATSKPGSFSLEPLSFTTVVNGFLYQDITAQTTSGKIVVHGFKGDVNGDDSIAMDDVVASLQLFIGVTNDPVKIWAGDLNCTDIVDAKDVNLLLRRVILGEPWPNCDGSWFYSEPASYSVSISPDGSNVAYATLDTVKRRSLNGHLIDSKLLNTNLEVNDLKYTAGGSKLFMVNRHHAFLMNNSDLSVSWSSEIRDSNNGAITSDGKVIATVSNASRQIDFRDTSHNEDSLFYSYPGFGGIFNLIFSPNDEIFAFSGMAANGGVSVFSLPKSTPDNLAPLYYLSGGSFIPSVTALMFSPDSKSLADAGSDHTIRLFDVDKNVLIQTFIGHPDLIHALAFNHSNTILSSGGDAQGGGIIKIWDVVTGVLKQEITTPGSVQSLSITPDSRFIAYACTNGVGLAPLNP